MAKKYAYPIVSQGRMVSMKYSHMEEEKGGEAVRYFSLFNRYFLTRHLKGYFVYMNLGIGECTL